MGVLLLIVVSLILALVQHGWLATYAWAPDLPLAFAAWVVVGGGTRWMLPRAWGVGALRDMIDPASLCFHAVAYVVLALGFLPVRGGVYRGRGAGWAAVAAVASLGLCFIDRWWAGLDLFAGFAGAVVVALGTALAALAMGWLFADLPTWVRPVEQGEAG